MNESPIQNATSVTIDLEKLDSVYCAIKKVLCVTRPFAVRLIGTEEMVQLNTNFRNCAENTDVLTFPSGLDDPLPLGDIAISIPYAREQSTMRGVSLENEVTALLVHGVLHLLGYDDIIDDDREAMQQKMNEVGEQIGIPIDGNWTSILHQDEEQL